MHMEANIVTAFANHLVERYGPEQLAIIADMPLFTVVSLDDGLHVVTEAADSQRRLLVRAIEAYAGKQGVTVHFDGETFAPFKQAA